MLILIGPATTRPLAPLRTTTPPARYAVPVDIVSDCSVDVTAALTRFIESVPDHATITLARRGCYLVEGTLEFRDRNGLIIDGQQATVRATTTADDSRSHWRFYHGTDLTIRNLRIVGDDSAGGTADAFVAELQHQMGIDLRGVRGVRIADVLVEGVYGDCVYVGEGRDSATWTTDVEINGLTCVANGRSGVSVTAGRNVRIADSSLLQPGLWGVDIEPNGGRSGAVDVTIEGNLFAPGAGHRPFVQAVGDSGGGIVRGIAVVDNTVRGQSLATQFVPAPGQRWSDITFTGNTSNTSDPLLRVGDGEVPAVVTVVDIDGVTVADNYQPGSGADGTFLYAVRTCDVTYSENAFPGGGTMALVLPFACGS